MLEHTYSDFNGRFSTWIRIDWATLIRIWSMFVNVIFFWPMNKASFAKLHLFQLILSLFLFSPYIKPNYHLFSHSKCLCVLFGFAQNNDPRERKGKKLSDIELTLKMGLFARKMVVATRNMKSKIRKCRSHFHSQFYLLYGRFVTESHHHCRWTCPADFPLQGILGTTNISISVSHSENSNFIKQKMLKLKHK